MTRPGTLLTERDTALLRSLAGLRFLTAAQVQRLHFPSEQTALRRLRRLEEARLVRRTISPTVPSQIVSLTRQGLEAALNGEAPSAGSGTRAPKLPGALFVKHLVAVNDFRIALQESLWRHPDVELLALISDSDRLWDGHGHRPRSPLLATVPIPGEEPIGHAADAGFVLKRGGRRLLCFVEVDLGTETLSQPRRGVGRLVRFYLHALSLGPAHALAPAFASDPAPDGVRVLVLTTSHQRVENIRRAWGRKQFAADNAKRLVWLGILDVLHNGELLSAPWVSLDPDDTEPRRLVASSGEG